jgi:hypothetical protein
MLFGLMFIVKLESSNKYKYIYIYIYIIYLFCSRVLVLQLVSMGLKIRLSTLKSHGCRYIILVEM